MMNSISLRTTDSRTQASGTLRKARWLWLCRILPAVLVLAAVAVFTNSAGSATSNGRHS